MIGIILKKITALVVYYFDQRTVTHEDLFYRPKEWKNYGN